MDASHEYARAQHIHHIIPIRLLVHIRSVFHSVLEFFLSFSFYFIFFAFSKRFTIFERKQKKNTQSGRIKRRTVAERHWTFLWMATQPNSMYNIHICIQWCSTESATTNHSTNITNEYLISMCPQYIMSIHPFRKVHVHSSATFSTAQRSTVHALFSI